MRIGSYQSSWETKDIIEYLDTLSYGNKILSKYVMNVFNKFNLEALNLDIALENEIIVEERQKADYTTKPPREIQDVLKNVPPDNEQSCDNEIRALGTFEIMRNFLVVQVLDHVFISIGVGVSGFIRGYGPGPGHHDGRTHLRVNISSSFKVAPVVWKLENSVDNAQGFNLI